MNLYFWPMQRIDGIFLLIGTNLGDRYLNIKVAVQKIAEKTGEIVKTSSVYETAAWGKTDQPNFFNLALQITTKKNPYELLKVLQSIEKDMGRIRIKKWEERIIDIDILYFADEVIDTPELVIPHPEIKNRRFALEPVVEIAADLIHPVLKKSNQQLLNECQDDLNVRKVADFIF